MRAALQLGAEFDFATKDEVDTVVGEGVDRILKRIPSRDRGIRKRPIDSKSFAALVGTWVLDLGSPAAGCIWWLLEVVVTGADDRTPVTGAVASLYCGPPALQQANGTIINQPSLGQLIRPAVALPALHAFSGEQFPIHDGENLTAIVYSPTNALTTISAVATVMELNASAVTLNLLR
jgi:hypothetical protein